MCFSRIVAISLIFLFASPVVWAAEVPREKIAFAYAAISPSMSGIWMAKEIGAFERNGLTAELVHISSGATAIQALVGGSVQAALGASNAWSRQPSKGRPDHRGGKQHEPPRHAALGSAGDPAG